MPTSTESSPDGKYPQEDALVQGLKTKHALLQKHLEEIRRPRSQRGHSSGASIATPLGPQRQEPVYLASSFPNVPHARPSGSEGAAFNSDYSKIMTLSINSLL